MEPPVQFLKTDYFQVQFMATICKVDFHVYNKELFSQMNLLLNKDIQCDDLYMRQAMETFNDKKTTMGFKTVTTLGEKNTDNVKTS